MIALLVQLATLWPGWYIVEFSVWLLLLLLLLLLVFPPSAMLEVIEIMLLSSSAGFLRMFSVFVVALSVREVTG